MGANLKIETLTDIVAHGRNLLVICGGQSCNHRGVVSGPKLSRLFFVRRWDTRKDHLGEHLRCSKCGSRPATWGGCYDKPTGPEWGPRSEADWKRLIARLRG